MPKTDNELTDKELDGIMYHALQDIERILLNHGIIDITHHVIDNNDETGKRYALIGVPATVEIIIRKHI